MWNPPEVPTGIKNLFYPALLVLVLWCWTVFLVAPPAAPTATTIFLDATLRDLVQQQSLGMFMAVLFSEVMVFLIFKPLPVVATTLVLWCRPALLLFQPHVSSGLFHNGSSMSHGVAWCHIQFSCVLPLACGPTKNDSRMIPTLEIDSSVHCMYSAGFIAASHKSSSSGTFIENRFLANMQNRIRELVTNTICHYHRCYGADARNCQHPCRWGTERDSDDNVKMKKYSRLFDTPSSIKLYKRCNLVC